MTSILSKRLVTKQLAILDSEQKINLNKIQNSLHFNRIVENILTELDSSTYDEIFDPECINIMINSRHYNWTRPVGSPPQNDLLGISDDRRLMK